MMRGLRRPHVPARQRRRARSTFVKFHWRPELGPAVDDLGRGGEDRRRRSGLPPPRPVRGDRRAATFPEWELGVQVFDEEFAASAALRRARRDQADPGRGRAGARWSGAWCSTATPTTSSPRPSRSRSARRTSCPASTSRTIRCCRAGCSRTSTRRSRGSARPTSTRSRSTRRSARSRTSSATGRCRRACRKGRANYEPNSLAEAGEDGGPREDPETGLHQLRHERDRRGRAELRMRPEPSPITTARRGCSSARMPRSSRRTSPRRSSSSCRRSQLRARARRGWSANLRNVDEGLAKRVAAGSACRCRGEQTAARADAGPRRRRRR